jgi:hypothetical protein
MGRSEQELVTLIRKSLREGCAARPDKALSTIYVGADGRGDDVKGDRKLTLHAPRLKRQPESWRRA